MKTKVLISKFEDGVADDNCQFNSEIKHQIKNEEFHDKSTQNVDQRDRIPAVFKIEPKKHFPVGSEPQSIIEFYCDDEIAIQSQWGFLNNQQDKIDPDDEKLEEMLFFSMSCNESLGDLSI